MNSLEYLWNRDKAYLMKHPSIHRKNTLKDYTIENCEYVELEQHYKYRSFCMELVRIIENKYPNIVKNCVKELVKK